jgi:hypothetical protein
MGGEASDLDVRLQAADTNIVLNFSVLRCAWRTVVRGRERADELRVLRALVDDRQAELLVKGSLGSQVAHVQHWGQSGK